MSGPKKPSHPTSAHGVIDVVEELPSSVPVGSQYGYYSCVGAIGVGGANGANPRDVAITLTANTSQSNALTVERLYSASLRLIKREGDNTYTAFYTPTQPYNIGPSTEAVDLAQHVSMWGLGIVTSRDEVTTEETAEPLLITSIRHTDWDPEARKSVSFDVIYHTAKKGPLAHSFGLFQIGREMALSGIITDWDKDKKTWIVQTTTVSVTSGHQNAKSFQNSSSGPPGGGPPRKRQLMEYDSLTSNPNGRKASTSSTSTSSTNAASPTLPSQSSHTIPSENIICPIPPPPQENIPEEGEEVESKNGGSFQNTYKKKRTTSNIMKDARKRLNGKL